MGLLKGNDDDKKPLARAFFKKNPNAKSPVIEIRLSSSEEWILIETKDCVCLLNAESKVGQTFWNTCQNFNGKAKGLCAVLAKGKLGFDLEPSELEGYWSWDGDNKVEFSTKKESTTGVKLALDLWKAMQLKPDKPELAIAEDFSRAGLESVKGTELEAAIVEVDAETGKPISGAQKTPRARSNGK